MTNKEIELLVGQAEELIQLGDSREKSFGYGMIFILKTFATRKHVWNIFAKVLKKKFMNPRLLSWGFSS